MTNILIYILLFLLILVCFVFYTHFKSNNETLLEYEHERQKVHRYYLNVLRREFKTLIIDKDRMLFMELERKAEGIERTVTKMDEGTLNMELALMRKEYPMVTDFDFIEENYGEYNSLFEYSDSFLLWQEWSESEFKFVDNWSQHEHSKNDVRDKYLLLVKYTALLFKHLSGGQDFRFYPYDISTGTSYDELLKTWRDKYGEAIPNLGQKLNK